MRDFLVESGVCRYVAASEIKVGDKVSERDGAYFEVSSIEPAPRGRIRFGLKNVAGYMVAPTSATVRRSAKVRVAA